MREPIGPLVWKSFYFLGASENSCTTSKDSGAGTSGAAMRDAEPFRSFYKVFHHWILWLKNSALIEQLMHSWAELCPGKAPRNNVRRYIEQWLAMYKRCILLGGLLTSTSNRSRNTIKRHIIHDSCTDLFNSYVRLCVPILALFFSLCVVLIRVPSYEYMRTRITKCYKRFMA